MYNLTESTFTAADRDRLPNVPAGGDTPDLIITGQDHSGGERWLLAVEAKMFHTPSVAALTAQMQRQTVLVAYLQTAFKISLDRTRHELLTPAGLPTGELTRVTWEEVLEAYDGVAPAYWTTVLCRALDHFEQLRSLPAASGTNADAWLTGEQIVAGHADGSLSYGWVGRRGAAGGILFTTDIETGNWRQTVYQVRVGPPEGRNPNWMPVADFIAATAQAPFD